VNDHLHPYCAYNAQAFDLSIFSRWGNGNSFNHMVYHQTASSTLCCAFRGRTDEYGPLPSINWNTGYLEKDGTYFYILTFWGCGHTLTVDGFITLLRGRSLMLPTNTSSSHATNNESALTDVSILSDTIPRKITAGSELIIYPNPTNEVLNVSLYDGASASEAYTLTICNYQGQVVAERNYTTNQNNVVNLNSFSKGIYSVRAVCKNTIYTKTIIKSE
jgi:Secretion system C-terminal sorting domain